jgi:hypothetical protein
MGELVQPELPRERLREAGWESVDSSVETLFELPMLTVEGATERFEDEKTRRALSESTGYEIDQPVRFFAATRLGFDPPLPPGTTPTMFAPTLRTAVRRQFAQRLRDRGLTDVERARSERFRVRSGTRARMTKFTGTSELGGGTSVPFGCWVAVWTHSGQVTIVSGGYPARSLAKQFDIEHDASLFRSPAEYRDEFLSLLELVE